MMMPCAYRRVFELSTVETTPLGPLELGLVPPFVAGVRKGFESAAMEAWFRLTRKLVYISWIEIGAEGLDESTGGPIFRADNQGDELLMLISEHLVHNTLATRLPLITPDPGRSRTSERD